MLWPRIILPRLLFNTISFQIVLCNAFCVKNEATMLYRLISIRFLAFLHLSKCLELHLPKALIMAPENFFNTLGPLSFCWQHILLKTVHYEHARKDYIKSLVLEYLFQICSGKFYCHSNALMKSLFESIKRKYEFSTKIREKVCI